MEKGEHNRILYDVLPPDHHIIQITQYLETLINIDCSTWLNITQHYYTLLRQLDGDGNGTVDFPEFLNIIAVKMGEDDRQYLNNIKDSRILKPADCEESFTLKHPSRIRVYNC